MPTSPTSVLLSDVAAEVLSALRDPSGVRYSPARITGWLVDALEQLAEDGDFWRVDLFETVSTQGVYALGGVPKTIHDVSHNGLSLDPADEALLSRLLGSTWRTQTGRPRYYLQAGAGKIRVVPTPTASEAGTALTYGSVTARTEAQYRGMEAYRMRSTIRVSDDAYVLWEPEDGQVTNEATAGNLLRVEYAYLPTNLTESTAVRRELKAALHEYALGKELSRSRRPEDVAAAPAHLASWERKKLSLGNDLGPVGTSAGSVNLVGACG